MNDMHLIIPIWFIKWCDTMLISILVSFNYFSTSNIELRLELTCIYIGNWRSSSMSTKDSIECYDLTVMVCLTTIHLMDVDPVHLFFTCGSKTSCSKKSSRKSQTPLKIEIHRHLDLKLVASCLQFPSRKTKLLN